MDGADAHRIVVAESFEPQALSRLEQVGRVVVLSDTSPKALIAAVADAEALLIRSKAHVTARIIESAPHLKVIGRAGPSLDHIDIRAARRRNIKVVYTPEVAVQSTAEFTLALILALVRRIPFLDRKVREGEFEGLRIPTGNELAHCTLGLLGADGVGERLATLCRAAFGMPVIWHDPMGGSLRADGAEAVDAAGLLTRADVLSIHLPATPETRYYLNRERLARLRPTAILVNTSRGTLIDSNALADALKTRKLAAAALDVFEVEPLPANHPLRTAPNCILTPHIAGTTTDASAGRFAVVDDVMRVLRGETPMFSAE